MVELEYYPIFWPFPVITVQGNWDFSSDSAVLKGRLRTAPFLKLGFLLVSLLPTISFLNVMQNELEVSLHGLAGSFGFLVLVCFMDLILLLMGSVFMQNAENRIRRILA